MKQKFFRILKRPWFLVVLAGVIGISTAAIASRKGAPLEFITVTRGTVAEEVVITGKVVPKTDVELAFERGGKISRAPFKVGDRVTAGTAIVEIDRSDLLADLAQGEASADVAAAKLAELESGSRPEEIAIQEVHVQNALVALGDAKQNLKDTLLDAYTKAEDAVHNKVDQFISNPKSASPQLSFSAPDGSVESKIESDRFVLESILAKWANTTFQIGLADDPNQFVAEVSKNLLMTKSFLDTVAIAVNSLIPSAAISQTTVTTYRTDVSTARTNVNTAIANISAAVEKLQTAQSTLNLENQELVLTKAGPTAEALAGAKATLKEAQAKVQNTKAQISKTVLRSPIEGIIRRLLLTAS